MLSKNLIHDPLSDVAEIYQSMTQINIEIEKIYERIKKAFQKLKYMQKFKKEGKYKFDASFSLSIWTKNLIIIIL